MPFDYDTIFSRLAELTALDAPTGFEEPVLRHARDRLATLADTVETDIRGNLYATRRGTDPDAPAVMVIAHADEIGFMVTGLTGEGFLRFTLIGGPTLMALPGRAVRVLADNGPVHGIIGMKPGHILSGEEERRVPNLSEMYIDIGAASASEAADWGIGPGTPAVLNAPLVRMQNPRLVTGKALDDRTGVLALLEAAALLKQTRIPATVTWCVSVEEETGLRGAAVAAARVQPDVVLVLDTIPAGGTPDLAEGAVPVALGAGPFIKVREVKGLSTHRPLRELVRRVAREQGIPHQYGVDTAGITDATSAQQAGAQIAALPLCIPRRYSHSAVEMADLADVAATASLVAAVLPAVTDRGMLARL